MKSLFGKAMKEKILRSSTKVALMDDYPRYMDRTIKKLDSMDFSPSAIKMDINRAMAMSAIEKPRADSVPKGGFTKAAQKRHSFATMRSMGTFKSPIHKPISLVPTMVLNELVVPIIEGDDSAQENSGRSPYLDVQKAKSHSAYSSSIFTEDESNHESHLLDDYHEALDEVAHKERSKSCSSSSNKSE